MLREALTGLKMCQRQFLSRQCSIQSPSLGSRRNRAIGEVIHSPGRRNAGQRSKSVTAVSLMVNPMSV